MFRVCLLGGGSFIDFPGSGALAALVMGFVAGVGWRNKNGANSVPKVLAGLWIVFQPILYGLIGTEISITELDPETVGWGFLILICGLVIRFIVKYFSVFGAKLDRREKLSVALAWIPKATVQAAIGPLALDMANDALAAAGDEVSDEDLNILQERVVLGKQVLTLAVLSIIITAPVGGAAIMTAGPRHLKKARHTLTTQCKLTSNLRMINS